jgi:hypothetical protein
VQFIQNVLTMGNLFWSFEAIPLPQKIEKPLSCFAFQFSGWISGNGDLCGDQWVVSGNWFVTISHLRTVSICGNKWPMSAFPDTQVNLAFLTG